MAFLAILLGAALAFAIGAIVLEALERRRPQPDRLRDAAYALATISTKERDAHFYHLHEELNKEGLAIRVTMLCSDLYPYFKEQVFLTRRKKRVVLSCESEEGAQYIRALCDASNRLALHSDRLIVDARFRELRR